MTEWTRTSITDYQDRNGFSFWPLSKIKSAAEEARLHRKGYWDFPDQDVLYVFADYLDWCWAYAILLTRDPADESPVFVLGKAELPIKVANSFREFVELYLEESPTIYDPPHESAAEKN